MAARAHMAARHAGARVMVIAGQDTMKSRGQLIVGKKEAPPLLAPEIRDYGESMEGVKARM